MKIYGKVYYEKERYVMAVYEIIKDVDKELHSYKLPPFMTQKKADHINSFIEEIEDRVQKDRIVSDEEYEIICKMEKDACDLEFEEWYKFNDWLHSTRRDLIGQPLDVIIEEMKKVDPKTLSRGWD